MTDFATPVADATYFMRRLAELRRAQGLTASMQFDLARSTLDDDQITQVATAFGAEDSSGWGLADMLHRVLSSTPEVVPVTDLKSLQQKLVEQGYAPPGAQANGVWDTSWYSASRRFDRDTEETIRSGNDWKSAPVEAGVRMLTNTLPSRVWQGIVGAAKGLVEQAPETASRVGLLGGAMAGAGIGAAVAGPPGALVGGVVGGVTGFFADLLTTDEGEEDQSVGAGLLDALSPFEEYTGSGGARKFFEDLGWVGAVASLAGGVGLAARGVRGTVAGVEAAGAAEATAAREAAAAQIGPLPGAPWEMASTAGRTPITLSTTSQLWLSRGVPEHTGVFSRLLTAALRRPIPGTAGALEKWIAEHGLLAQSTRPAFQLVNKVYTGAVAGSLGARFAAGFTGPFRGLGAEGTTTIEKAIATTAPLSTIGLPGGLGDAVDLAAFFIWPERFFPWPQGAIGRAATKWLLGDTRLLPYGEALSRGTSSFREDINAVKDHLTIETDLQLRANFGLDQKTSEIVETTVPSAERSLATKDVKNAIIRRIRQEGPIQRTIEQIDAGEVGQSMLAEVLKKSLDHWKAYAAWLREKFGDRGLQGLQDWAEAQRVALDIEAGLDKGALVEFGHTVYPRSLLEARAFAGDVALRGGEARRLTMAAAPESLTTVLLRRHLKRLEAEAKRLETLARKVRDPNSARQIWLDAQKVRAELEEAKTWFTPSPGRGTTFRTPETMRVVPAREDFVTRGGYLDYKRDYETLRGEVLGALKTTDLASQETLDARMRLNEFLDGLVDTGVIIPEMAERAKTVRPGREVSRFLQRAADNAARDIQLPAEDMARLARLGYKPVLTGEDVLFGRDMSGLVEATGIGDYTRRANFFESIGFSPTRVPDEDVSDFMQAAVRASVGTVLEKSGVRMNAKTYLRRLQSGLHDLQNEGVIKGPVIVSPSGKVRLFSPDLRSLTPDDILAVAEKQGIVGFDDAVARDMYGALKRGAAYGGEAKFLHPLDTTRLIGNNLRVKGLPGFSDVIRTWHVQDAKSVRPILYGAGLGATEGLIEGRKDGYSLDDMVRGAIMGASAGVGLRWLLKKTYGYLPDALVRLNSALRYTLSFSFDAKRYAKNNVIAMTKYELPPIFRPEKYIRTVGELKSPYGGIVSGDAAWRDAVRYFDELNGTQFFRVIDDTDRYMFQRGSLGFAPRNFEIAHAMMMYQKGWGREKIAEAVRRISRYGIGRAAAEKSLNFVFFPFSFEMKFLTALGDFMLQAPARALVLHEGWRLYAQSTLRDDWHDFAEKHLPILRELADLNALNYGIGPGRFFLEQLDDNRTNVGKVSQILAAVFVPSGAATPLSQAAGQLGDLSVQAFAPVLVTGESLRRTGIQGGILDIVDRYIPFTRDAMSLMHSLDEQRKALPSYVGGEGETSWSQFQDYTDELRAYKADLTPLALALGYKDSDALLASDVGVPFKAKFNDFRMELAKKYPSGFNMSNSYEDSTLVRERAIRDLADYPGRSAAEDAIVHIAEERDKWRLIGRFVDLPSDIFNMLATTRIRAYAARYVGDRRFRELWDYLFAPQYGPIATIKPPASTTTTTV